MIFCMLCIPLVLIPMAGLAIDATILRIVQSRLSASVDGAALGVGRLLGTSASPDATAKEFVKANFVVGAAGFWGANNLAISTVYTPGITKTIVVNASADVPLLFMQIFGQRKATVTAAATATRTDSRIMLVIDRSTSMTNVQSDGNTAFDDASLPGHRVRRQLEFRYRRGGLDRLRWHRGGGLSDLRERDV